MRTSFIARSPGKPASASNSDSASAVPAPASKEWQQAPASDQSRNTCQLRRSTRSRRPIPAEDYVLRAFALRIQAQSQGRTPGTAPALRKELESMGYGAFRESGGPTS